MESHKNNSRSALLLSIQAGTKLKRTTTIDKSSPCVPKKQSSGSSSVGNSSSTISPIILKGQQDKNALDKITGCGAEISNFSLHNVRNSGQTVSKREKSSKTLKIQPELPTCKLSPLENTKNGLVITGNKSSLYGHNKNLPLVGKANLRVPNLALTESIEVKNKDKGFDQRVINRHHSMKLSRFSRVLCSGPAQFATLRTSQQLCNSEDSSSNTRVILHSTGIGRPTVAPPKPPTLKPPAPPTPARSTSNSNLNINCHSNKSLSGPSKLNISNSGSSKIAPRSHVSSNSIIKASTILDHTLNPIILNGNLPESPPLPPHRSVSVPLPPQRQTNQIGFAPLPPQRHSSMRAPLTSPSANNSSLLAISNNCLNSSSKISVDLELRFEKRFHNVTEFPKPQPFVSMQKAYSTRSAKAASGV